MGACPQQAQLPQAGKGCKGKKICRAGLHEAWLRSKTSSEAKA